MSMTSVLRGQTLKKDDFRGPLKESLSQRVLQKRELGMPLVFLIAGSEVVMKKTNVSAEHNLPWNFQLFVTALFCHSGTLLEGPDFPHLKVPSEVPL